MISYSLAATFFYIYFYSVVQNSLSALSNS